MYINREICLQAEKYLDRPEIQLFIGAGQVGKTTILRQLQEKLAREKASTFFLNLEDPDYLKMLNESPKNLLKIFTISPKKKNFIFIDEIQYLINPSNFLKYFYDEYHDSIKLLVSGSSAFYLDRKFKDSLAGRKKIFYVRTLSFREFLLFKNEESLSKKNFTGLGLSEKEKISLYYHEYIIYGGYPRVVLSGIEEKKDILQEIAYSYIKKDLFDAHIRDDETFFRLFKILASGIGELVNASELANTLNISRISINNYLAVMQKSFHIHLLKPFYRNVRKELAKMPKIYFHDLGLRNFFAGNFENYVKREDKGFLLENAVFIELLKKYNEDDLNFWRTVSQNEIDFIIAEKTAMEIKASPSQFDPKKVKTFFENYPEIKLTIATIDKHMDKIKGYPVINVWEI